MVHGLHSTLVVGEALADCFASAGFLIMADLPQYVSACMFLSPVQLSNAEMSGIRCSALE